MPTDRENLREAMATIEELEAFIERMKAAPKTLGVIVEIYPKTKRVLVSAKGELVDVEMPNEFSIHTGQTVLMLGTGQIIEAAQTVATGKTVVVKTVGVAGDPNAVEIENEGHTRIVRGSKRAPKVAVNHRVVLDASGNVIIQDLGKPAAEHFARKSTGVTWDDIGGLEDVKEQMLEIIEKPRLHPELYAQYGFKAPKGILLSGPAGCGKTMIGKAAATSLEKVFGSASLFMYVKGPEVLNKYVGESERTIREIFSRARDYKKETGVPAVVFIDEAESLLSKRGSGVSSDMEKTIVPAFLAEMDGMEESGALVILATNRPDRLDTAVVRDGRIDRKIVVPRPTRQVAADIAELNFKSIPTKCDAAAAVVGELFSPAHAMYDVLSTTGKNFTITMADMVSGAMIANVARRASGHALRRDAASKLKNASGVTAEDVTRAVLDTVKEHRSVTHEAEIMEFAERHSIEIGSISVAKCAAPVAAPVAKKPAATAGATVPHNYN